MYLADSVIHLNYSPHAESDRRTLKVIKARSSRHSEEVHPYQIIKGIGLCVGRGKYIRSETRDRVDLFAKKMGAKGEQLPPRIHERLASDFEAEYADFEERIRQAGGIDLQVLGIGGDGHIAFCEPGSSLAGRTSLVALHPQTIADNARFFDNQSDVPRRALTT